MIWQSNRDGWGSGRTLFMAAFVAFVAIAGLWASDLRVSNIVNRGEHFEVMLSETDPDLRYLQVWEAARPDGPWKIADVILDPAEQHGWKIPIQKEPGVPDGNRFFKFLSHPRIWPANALGDGVDDLRKLQHPLLDPLLPVTESISEVGGEAGLPVVLDALSSADSWSILHVDGNWSGVAEGHAPEPGSPLIMGSNAFARIQAAIDTASGPAAILVAPGVYTTALHIQRPLIIAASIKADPRDGTPPSVVIRPSAVSDSKALIDIEPPSSYSSQELMRVILLDLQIDGTDASAAMVYPLVGIHARKGTGLFVERCLFNYIRPHAIGMQTGWGIVASDADLLVRFSVFDQWGKAAVSAFGQTRLDLIANTFIGLDLSAVRQFSQNAIVLQNQARGSLIQNRFEGLGTSGQVNPALGFSRIADDASVGYAIDITATTAARPLVLRDNTFNQVQAVMRDARRIGVSHPVFPLDARGLRLDHFENNGNLAPKWVALGAVDDAYALYAVRDDDPNVLNYAIHTFNQALHSQPVISLAGGSSHILTRDLVNPPLRMCFESVGEQPVHIWIPNQTMPQRIAASENVHIGFLPQVTIQQPSFQEGFGAGTTTITLVVNADTHGRGPALIELYADDELLVSATGHSLTNLWSPGPGSHNLRATISDALGLSASSVPVPVSVGSPDAILWQYWDDLPGHAIIEHMLLNERYPAAPDGALHLDLCESPPGRGSNYGARFRGYLIAPQTGEYRLALAAGGRAQLWLSRDDDPANAALLLSAQNTAQRQWTSPSAPVNLQAAQRYYIEVLHKVDIAHHDHLAVGWTLPDGTHERPIPGLRMGPYILSPPLPRFSISEKNLYHIPLGALDSDGDGLPDEEEVNVAHTDPDALDTLILLGDLPASTYIHATGAWGYQWHGRLLPRPCGRLEVRAAYSRAWHVPDRC